MKANQIEIEMQRRAPGKDKLSTSRKEADKPVILSGIFEGLDSILYETLFQGFYPIHYQYYSCLYFTSKSGKKQ